MKGKIWGKVNVGYGQMPITSKWQKIMGGK